MTDDTYHGPQLGIVAFPLSSRAWRQLPALDRIIMRSEQAGPCVVFTGRKTPDGYGRMTLGGSEVSPHRVAWEALVGPIPDGMTIDHLCRNRTCWWPDHLRVVEKKTNTLDGYGLTAQNARKERCRFGHKYRRAVYPSGRPYRTCDPCARRRAAEHRTRKKEKK